MEAEDRGGRKGRKYGLCMEAKLNLGEMGKSSRGYIWSTKGCLKQKIITTIYQHESKEHWHINAGGMPTVYSGITGTIVISPST